MGADSHSQHLARGAGPSSLERKSVAAGSHSQLVAITIPAGAESGEEVHNGSDQAVFVVAGTGVAILNGHAENAVEHDAIFIPAGTVYNFKNSGAGDLKVFVTYSPPVTSEAASAQRSVRTNSYAIARSAPVADQSDVHGRQAFPTGIKWSSWQSPTLRNVLVAIDFSAASDAVLPYAISIARHYRSNLHMAHIITPDVSGLIAPQLIDQIRSELKAAATNKIEEQIRAMHVGDLNVQPIVMEGAVADALLGTIRSKDIDLVVLGTHGRRGLRKLVLGSVAEEVFRLAPCPVLTVGPKAEEVSADPMQLRHIIYPMELKGDVVKAAGYPVSIAKEYHAELTFLNVIEQPSMSDDEKAWINVISEHWFEDKIAPDLGIAKVHFVHKFGDPATAILQCAAERGADLIVMNIQGGHPLLAGLVPGVAHRVVAEASCPVLTIR